MIMAIPPNNQSSRANTIRKVFSRETSVSVDINAGSSIIWSLLTNASGYPGWSNTVVSIEGNIAPGETIKLKSTLDPKRTFKLRVMEFQPETRLAWGDAMGKRIFTLNDNKNGSVRFSMTEKIGGPLFPLFSKMIPSFDKPFDQFASDLKTKAEFIMNAI
jgi:uncharacterized protein YndB with AHSA1/START domain